MKKTLLLMIAVITVINISFAQERLIIKPQGFDYRNLPVNPQINVPVTDGPRVIITPMGSILVDANTRILPTSGNQTELSACIWKGNTNYVFIGANSDPGQGYYYTTNGGTTWGGADLLPGSVFISSDPACIFDNTGRIHFNYFDNIMVCDRSTNGGQNWLGRITVPTPGSFDKNHMAVDDNPSSPYYGKLYVVWSNFAASAPPIILSMSIDGGATYSSSQQIGAPVSGHYEQGCNIQVGPTGQVYCIWAAPISGSPYTEDFMGFAKSTNGGVNWTTTPNAFDVNGIRGNILSTNIRINSFPSMGVDRTGGPRNGYIYVTWGQRNLAPAGSDADICFCYSSNSGTNWSSPVRVNNDALSNGKNQFMPWLQVDQSSGIIGIVFYDTRDVSTTDSCHTYMAISNDGGATWNNMRVSDHAQRPVPLSGYASGYYGDYIALTGHNNTFWPFWMDNRSGPAQVYTVKVTIGPSIAHTQLPNTENLAGPYVVNCVITPAGSAIDPTRTRLLWSRNNVNITDSVLMTNTSGNNWTANIPGNGSPATYRYYLKTADMLNRVATLPSGAPASLFQFQAQADVTPPVVTTTPLGNIPKTNWPATVIANATDNIGIDSVWVRWYKNNTGTGIKHVKLNPIGGNNYSNPFNSDTSQVAYNDSIFYRVFAVDNSSNHNRDSTALYSFKIIAIAYGCVGTGSSTAAWPYNTYWHDSRTQMLYTASEIIAGSGAPGNITKVAFNISSAAAQTMNGFNIRMQNTSATSLSGFVSSGWTTVYTGTYTVPGTGWQTINLQTPFTWNGTQNLLIEICFDNTSYTSATNVYCTSAAGMIWEQHADNSTGCSFAAGTNGTNLRPNICMTINLLVGNNSSQLELPKSFALSQNYPNPFNPTTSIKYSVPKQTLVKLVVYDLLGREVAVLVNTMKQPGSYEANFDASNLASGAYFYRIEAGDFTDVKKMVLIK